MSTLAVRIRPHYPWVVVAATFVVLVTAAGFRATTGVLLLPLEDTFGWSSALIGGAVALNLLVYGLGAPFAAAVIERFGVRRVCAAALIDGRDRLGADHRHDPAVATLRAVGDRDRIQHRRGRRAAGSDHRQSLVRAPPRDSSPAC